MERATVAVVGLGSIGGIAAGLLYDAGRHDVTACIRTPFERLIVERIDDIVDVPIRALTDPADAEPVDWVLLATKAHQTASTALWLARLCAPRTRVAVLQNGINHAALLAPFVDGATVVPTIVYYNGERLGPGRVRFRRAGKHDFAVRDEADGRAFAELFDGTGLRVLLSDDFATLAWRKLLINGVANPVTALTLQRQSVFRRTDIQELCIAVLEEAAAVGRADGARLEPNEPERIMATLLTYPPEVGTSMYFDRLAGRPFEVEALSGAIVAAGEQHGIPTPLNRAFLTLLRAISEGVQYSSEP